MSDFVREQWANAMAPWERLGKPKEQVYPIADPEVGTRLGISRCGECD
jgi:hypothetical protein